MTRTVTAAMVLWTCIALVDVASAQPALKKLEELIRGQREGAPAEAAPDRPEKVEPGDAQQIQEPGRQPPPEGGLLERGYLGAVADDRDDRGRGVRVLEVLPDGPADKAGLRADDLITGVGGVRVRQMSDMAAILEEIPVGGVLSFEILRGEQPQEVQVTLGRRPRPEERRFKTLAQPREGPPERLPQAPPKKPPVGAKPAPIPADVKGRIEMLERRIEQLENRIRQLEQALAKTARP